MVHYRRNFVPGGTYFFTVMLADRRGSVLTERIDALGLAFRQCRALHPFETIAIAVLPEHLHCVWTLPDGDADYSTRWSLIKRAFTRKQHHEGPRDARSRKILWQSRFWEHTIRDETDLERHVDYIHCNAVTHGHATRAADWPHSSFHRYVMRGSLASDWASDAKSEPAEFGDRCRNCTLPLNTPACSPASRLRAATGPLDVHQHEPARSRYAKGAGGGGTSHPVNIGDEP